MTIPSTPRKAGPYTGNGVQTAFPFAFKVFSGSDVEVRLVQPGGDEVLVAPESYTVSLNSNQETSPGGTVTYPLVGAPIASGARLAVVGAIDYDQPLDLPSGGNFSPLALENQLDRTVMQVQQLAEQQGRALTLPVTSSGVVSAALPSPEASALLAWNSSATALENVNANSAAFTVAYTDCAFDTFTGDGTQTVFSLSKPPANIANLDLSVDGQTYVPGVDYTLSSNLLAFTTAPIAGAQILARYGQVPGQLPVDVLNAVRGPFLILDNTVTYDFSVPTGKNALSISPTISPGVTVTVPPGSEFVTLDEYSEAGEVNTASNLGSGAGLFADKNGADLRFKSLVGGGGVTVTPGSTTITISATPGEVNTASNLAGVGEGLFSSKSGVDLQFKRLRAGSGVTLTSDTTGVTIAASGGAATQPFFYAKDYGAIGDGVADDTSAIQSAINAANAVGGVLYFHPGTYKITSGLTVNNSADTDPFAPKMSVLGAGPTASVIWATGGEWNALSFVGGTSGAGMHSHQMVSNIAVYKDSGGSAMSFTNVAFATFLNVYARGAKYGIYATDILSSSFYGCQFLWNSVAGVRFERSGTTDGFQSGPNAINFHGCVFGNNGHFGAWLTDGGNINFHGGSVEGNGITGVDVFPRGGIYCVNAGLESGVGLNVSGTYFENNKGTADVWVANTTQSVAHHISGATFNRISSVNFTDYNVYGEGSSVTTEISVQGCGFKHFNTYSPNASRRVFHKPFGHKVRYSWAGCYFSSTVDSPVLRNWTSDKLAYGVITSSGTLAGDSTFHNVSSVSKVGTGRYQIFYADPSESTNPTVVASALAGNWCYVFSSAPDYCTIQVNTLAGAAVDSPVAFTAFG